MLEQIMFIPLVESTSIDYSFVYGKMKWLEVVTATMPMTQYLSITEMGLQFLHTHFFLTIAKAVDGHQE